MPCQREGERIGEGEREDSLEKWEKEREREKVFACAQHERHAHVLAVVHSLSLRLERKTKLEGFLFSVIQSGWFSSEEPRNK